MSCHNIGRGMNDVAKEILQCFDAGKMDRETAKQLVTACRESVGCCDGNPDEAVMVFQEQGRCSRCFKTNCSARRIWNWDSKLGKEAQKRIDAVAKEEAYHAEMLSDVVCPDCLIELLGFEPSEMY